MRLALCLLATLGLTSPVAAQNFNAAAPNAPDQSPAFSGQTRAPVLDQGVQLRRQVVATGLDQPWGMDQLPDGTWLVTEKPGRMRIIGAGGASAPIAGLPPVDARGQGGLLDVTVAPNFDQTRRVWWSYAEPLGGGRSTTSVATGVLSPDGATMGAAQVIFRQQPAWSSTSHYGARLVFDGRGALFITTGERSQPQARVLAQDVTTHFGKVLRIAPGGGAAPGNPRIPNGQPEIWSWGHRNLQAAAMGPDGALWTVEHGPRGGDELNRPQSGRNYGWPVISYGREYSGGTIGRGETARPGMEQPLYYWDPNIAPSGMAFYDGNMFPAWRGDVLIGALAGQSLVRLTLDGTRVTGEARYLQGEGRIRDVDVAQDGSIMILTESPAGAMIRLTPAN